MPTYQYRCRDCGEDLEVVQSFTDDALTECPSCQGTLRKVFAAPGIAFKGSGFYKTDSRGSSKSKSESKSESKESSSDTKSDSKSDAKSDGKSDSKSSTSSDKKDSSAKKAEAKSA